MSTAADETGIGVLMLFAALIILAVAGISLARSWMFVFSSQNGRGERARYLIGLTGRRILVGTGIVVAVGYSWSYWKDARLRSLITSRDCETERSPDGLYTARYCYVGKQTVLRLYDASGQQLLVERTYVDYSGVPVRLYWKQDAVKYDDGNDNLGVVHLPPSSYDRLLAKLP